MSFKNFNHKTLDNLYIDYNYRSTDNITKFVYGNDILLAPLDGSGTDLSSNNITPTLGSTISYASTSPLSNYTQYLSLNGSSTSWITYAASSLFNFGTSNFTAECWFKTSGVTGDWNSIIGQFVSTTSGVWHIDIQGGYLDFTYNDGSWHNNVSSKTVTDNVWHHAAISRSGTNIYVFCDGVLLETVVTSTSIGKSDQVFQIGVNNIDNNVFTGSIAGVRITNWAKYTSAFTPDTNFVASIPVVYV